MRNIFLKNLSNGCFCISTRSVYCRTTTFSLLKNDVTHIFWLSIFFGLICGKNIRELRLGTRMSSIFQTLPQKSFFNPVEYLRWSIFIKIFTSLKPLSIFAQKSSIVYVRPGSKYASVSSH